MHRPLWIPYALYTEVDYVYGWPAFNTQDGWPSAQGFLNALETAAYIWYMWMLWRWGVEEKGKSKGRGRKSKTEEAAVWMWERRRVEGLHGAQMVLVLSVTSWITVSKTVLYCESCWI